MAHSVGVSVLEHYAADPDACSLCESMLFSKRRTSGRIGLAAKTRAWLSQELWRAINQYRQLLEDVLLTAKIGPPLIPTMLSGTPFVLPSCDLKLGILA